MWPNAAKFRGSPPWYFVHFSRFGVSHAVDRAATLGHVDPETFDFYLINLDPTSPVGLSLVALFFSFKRF